MNFFIFVESNRPLVENVLFVMFLYWLMDGAFGFMPELNLIYK